MAMTWFEEHWIELNIRFLIAENKCDCGHYDELVISEKNVANIKRKKQNALKH